MNTEETEMVANARAAYQAGEITKEQLQDVEYIVARAMAERAVWN